MDIKAREFARHLEPQFDFDFLTKARISLSRDNRTKEELSTRYKPAVI